MKNKLHFSFGQVRIFSDFFQKILVFTFLLLGLSFTLSVQLQSVLYSVGNSSICNGQSTTLAVNVDGGYGPYSIVYSDGTTNFTVNDYVSNDTDGDAAITVSPSSSKTYNLVSVNFENGSLPVSSSTVTITVHSLPSSIVGSTNPASPVCSGVDFQISATATNGSSYELWNAANNSKIGDIPFTTSIIVSTSYTIRAISNTTPACTSSATYTVNLETTKPIMLNITISFSWNNLL